MVEDAADDAAFGDEGVDAHHAPTAGTDERVDFVNAASELSPAAPESGHEGDAKAAGGGERAPGPEARDSARWAWL